MLKIDDEFNMDDIEKDDELQNELRLLGWRDEEPIAVSRSREKRKSEKTKREPELRASVTSDEAPENLNYSLVDPEVDADVDVEFTDEDMKDPYLLSQLRTLSVKDDDLNLIHENEDEGSSNDGSDDDEEKFDATRRVQSVFYPTIKSVNTIATTPTTPKKIVSTSAPVELADSVTADVARSRAIAYHKDGNKQEALKWLKISKSMELDSANNSAKSRSKETASALNPIPKNGVSPRVTRRAPSVSEKKDVEPAPKTLTQNERFSYLESALNTAIKETLREAQLLINIDRPASAKKLQSHKRYKAELGVLASRKCLEGAEPAPFTWKNVEKETVIEHLEVGDDQLFLDIESILDLEASLVGQSSRSVVLSYDLGFPRDAPITGKINGKVDGKGNVTLNFHSVLPIIKRGRSLSNFLKKTRATFEVSLIRGMFSSNVTLGTASLILTDLNTKCKCGGVLPMEKSLSNLAGRKSNQCSAGTVTAYLKVRKPIQEAEIIRTTERTLVIDAWPSVSHVYKSPSLNPALPKPLTQDKSDRSSESKDQQPPLKKMTPDTNSKSSVDYSLLSAREKADPCSADFLESNDVLEAEIAHENAAILVIEGKMAKNISEEDESAMFTMKLRLQLMTSKLNALVSSVQQEELSFGDYIDKVKSRLERDKVLIQWVAEASRRAEPPVDSAQHKSSLLRRIGIMERELSEANDAS